jgi:hypothetical protein
MLERIHQVQFTITLMKLNTLMFVIFLTPITIIYYSFFFSPQDGLLEQLREQVQISQGMISMKMPHS